MRWHYQGQDGIKNIGRMQVQRNQCWTPEYTPEYILTLNPKPKVLCTHLTLYNWSILITTFLTHVFIHCRFIFLFFHFKFISSFLQILLINHGYFSVNKYLMQWKQGFYICKLNETVLLTCPSPVKNKLRRQCFFKTCNRVQTVFWHVLDCIKHINFSWTSQ